MKIKTTLSTSAAILALGCVLMDTANAEGEKVNVAANSPSLINLNDLPDWLNEAIAREKKVKSKTRLKIKPFNVNQKVLGKLKLIEDAEGTLYYLIDIGSDTPIECYVFTDFDGAANSLYSIVEASLAAIATLNKKTLAEQYTFAVDSGVMGHTPYLLLDTLYLLGEGSNRVSGILKGLSAETRNGLQVCLHNEVGYRNTFFEVFTSFLSAFQAAEGKPEFFEVIYQLTINGITAGYGQEKYSVDHEGDINNRTSTALLMPVDASAVARSDSVTVSWSRQDGSLINASEYSVENGVLASSLAIQMNNDKWQVEGELQGKVFQAELAHTDWLLSSYGNYIDAVDLKNSEQSSVERYMWLPEADPSSAVKVELSKIADHPKANFKMDMGPLLMKIFVDDKGIIRQGSLEQGPVVMELNLLHVQGEPILP